MKKFIIALVVVALIALLVLAVHYRITTIKKQENIVREGIEEIQKREGYPVVLTSVQEGPFEIWRAVQGKVEGYRQAFISTPDAARVARIRYKVGDAVKADTPIISLDENDPKNLSQVKFLRTVYENAAKEYERYQNLYKSGGVSKDVLDKVYLQLKKARTNLNAARATVHLTSPIDGILLALYTRVGENAEPNKTLAIVSWLDVIRILVSVSDREVHEFEVGHPVTITAASGTELQGSVDRISLGTNPDTGLFEIVLKVDNTSRALKVGMFITARVRVMNEDKALIVNSACILKDFDGNNFVWRVQDGVAHKVVITVEAINDTHTVVSGLNPDDQIVLQGKSLLREGVKVNIVDRDE